MIGWSELDIWSLLFQWCINYTLMILNTALGYLLLSWQKEKEFISFFSLHHYEGHYLHPPACSTGPRLTWLEPCSPVSLGWTSVSEVVKEAASQCWRLPVLCCSSLFTLHPLSQRWSQHLSFLQLSNRDNKLISWTKMQRVWNKYIKCVICFKGKGWLWISLSWF